MINNNSLLNLGENHPLNLALKEIKNDYDSIDNGDELLHQITGKLVDVYNSPPIKEFEFLICKTMTPDEVRSSLFHPLEEQCQYYSLILQKSMLLKENKDIQRLSLLIISLIYLIHRKNWSFLQEFIISDGLTHLIDMISHENLQYRGQVLEIFMSVTNCDTFDWFQPPKDTSSHQLHQCLLSLHHNPDFTHHLLSNRRGSYPGGSLRALQILAFWYSWVRALYTKNQQLLLDEETLRVLKFWTAEKDSDEYTLSQTLYEDFGFKQFGKEVTDDLILSHPTSSVAPIGEKVLDLMEEINASKAAGNDHFRNHRWDDALVSYLIAIQLFHMIQKEDGSDPRWSFLSHPCPTLTSLPYLSEETANRLNGNDRSNVVYSFATASTNSSDGSEHGKDLYITLVMNASTASWKKAETIRDHYFQSLGYGTEYLEGTPPSPEVIHQQYQSWLRDSIQFSEHILRVEPFHTKAVYRQVLAFNSLNQPVTGLKKLEKVLNGMEKSSPNDVKMLSQLKYRCLANILLHGSEEEVGGFIETSSNSSAVDGSNQSRISQKQLVILKTLVGQHAGFRDVLPQSAGQELPWEWFHVGWNHHENWTGWKGIVPSSKQTNPFDQELEEKKENEEVQPLARKQVDGSLVVKRKEDTSSQTTAKTTSKVGKEMKRSAKVQAILSKLRSNAKMFMSSIEKDALIWSGLDANPDPSMTTIFESGIQEVIQIWKCKVSLQDSIHSSLDEALLMFFWWLFVVMVQRMAKDTTKLEEYSYILLRMLTEIPCCDRFQTVLTMALYGNTAGSKSIDNAICIVSNLFESMYDHHLQSEVNFGTAFIAIPRILIYQSITAVKTVIV